MTFFVLLFCIISKNCGIVNPGHLRFYSTCFSYMLLHLLIAGVCVLFIFNDHTVVQHILTFCNISELSSLFSVGAHLYARQYPHKDKMTVPCHFNREPEDQCHDERVKKNR